MRYFLLALTFAFAGHASATGEINVLTDLKSPFPPGCVAVSLPQGPENDEYLVRDDIFVPSVEDGAPAAEIEVDIWRMGCHDEGYSVVMIRLEKISGGAVLVPRAYAEADEVSLPEHQAQLIRHPAVGNVGASGNDLVGATTYMLGVDQFHLDPQNDTRFLPTDYNDAFTLELYWGDYAGADPSHRLLYTIPEYVPQLDLPQTDYPVLHGRMSGQYTVDGAPYSGVVLQIGEQVNRNSPDTNSVTVLFFTYVNGAPFWVIGTKGQLVPGRDAVTLEMSELAGGEFITSPPGSYDPEDVAIDSIGNMTVEVLDCNRILVGYNFHEGGFGAGSFEAERLIRMAGYDCNPWRLVAP